MSEKPKVMVRNISTLSFFEVSKAYRKFLDRTTGLTGWKGPPLRYHRKVLAILRAKQRKSNFSYSKLIGDIAFLDCLYLTLAVWGLHGMRGPYLKEFDDFQKEISKISNNLSKIGKLTIDSDWKEILAKRNEISNAFMTPRITFSKNAILVANSKLLHHLNPDLFPPIDRAYIYRFFFVKDINAKQVSYSSNFKRQLSVFWSILKEYHEFNVRRSKYLRVLRRMNCTRMETSKTKVIDNIVVGRVLILRKK
jgi:hypothetical protein